MLQSVMFEPPTVWVPPNLASLPSWEGAKRVSVDTETHDPDLKKTGIGVRREGKLVGVSFAIEDGPSAYLPFGHAGGDNLPREQVLEYLRCQAKVFKGDLVGANLPYDLDYLLEAGVAFSPSRFLDVQIAEPLIDENHLSYSLDSIAERNGLPGKAEDGLRAAATAFGIDPKKDLWRLPARHVGAYAERDARLPLELLRRQERRLEEQGLLPIWDIECRLLPVLLAMRRVGVAVDFDQLEKVERYALDAEVRALAEASRLSGVRLGLEDTTKPRALARAFDAVGVQLPRTPTGEPSVAKKVLEALNHPLAASVREAARWRKLRGTFVESIREHAVRGRVHTTFNQLRRTDDGSGDESGTIARLSCADPGLQQQPTRDPVIGPMWRGIYKPDAGGQWCCIDYSQQEPRWIVHFAEKTKCDGARDAGDRYRENPDLDNHQMMADMIGWVAKEGRSRAKTIYLGLCYGMGGAKLCRSIGLPTKWITGRDGRPLEVAGDEGALLIRQFGSGAPFLKQLADKAKGIAEKNGFIRTVLGRRAHFPPIHGGGYDWTHKALNRLIQGSAADQTKLAMVQAHEAGIRLQLQVHDELDLTISDVAEAVRLATIMRDVVPCSVPHRPTIKIGPSWGEIQEAA